MQIEFSKCDGICNRLTASEIKWAIIFHKLKTNVISIVNKRHLKTDSSALYLFI